MGHITSKNAYKSLEEQINWFTQGAPASETFYKILQVLYTEKENRLTSVKTQNPRKCTSIKKHFRELAVNQIYFNNSSFFSSIASAAAHAGQSQYFPPDALISLP